MNATMKHFGYPDTLLAEGEKWAVLLRPAQVTLGALILVCKEPTTAFSALSAEAFAELRTLTGCIEQALMRTFAYDKINYLMLMMVDPDVHFHVLPRYAAARIFQDHTFHDHGWPGLPELSRANATGDALSRAILDALHENWGPEEAG